LLQINFWYRNTVKTWGGLTCAWINVDGIGYVQKSDRILILLVALSANSEPICTKVAKEQRCDASRHTAKIWNGTLEFQGDG
jgi:hypothetical protein